MSEYFSIEVDGILCHRMTERGVTSLVVQAMVRLKDDVEGCRNYADDGDYCDRHVGYPMWFSLDWGGLHQWMGDDHFNPELDRDGMSF